jgi:hypothetical protein
MLLLAVVLAAAGCGNRAQVGSAPMPEASPKERVTVDPAPGAGPALACGQPFQPHAPGVLTLTGRFPAIAAAGAGSVTGTVEVTSRVAVRGVVLPRADVFLVRDGRVVTTPMAQDAMAIRWDLTPGRTERLPADATLVACDPGGAHLPPGTYQLYARVVITPDDGAGVTSFGGPWPLEVR